MSSDIKPGDLCLIVASSCSPDTARLVGTECEVLKSLDVLSFFTAPGHVIYIVRLSTGEKAMVCRTCLRKKQPPAETGSWSSIERITGWKPAVRPETV